MSGQYLMYDMMHAALTPSRHVSEFIQLAAKNPMNPLAHTLMGREIAAAAELYERITKKYEKPEMIFEHTMINGRKVAVEKEVVVEKPFCKLIHFKRKTNRKDPVVLLCAPLAGHHATLLAGTVEALLPHHDVYLTDWQDAHLVPLNKGKFDLDNYIGYLRSFLSLLGPDTNIVAICQTVVPVFATVALMAAENDPNQPSTMTLMGGPIDTRINQTPVTKFAMEHPLSWFEKMLVSEVPFYYPGAARKVYPGFTQINGFMAMHPDNHLVSHINLFKHLATNDTDKAQKLKEFYDNYLAVIDLPAEFYLQTVDVVFQRHLLPKGQLKWHDETTDQTYTVRPGAIKKTALLTVEGEKDDISAPGQTAVAHELAYNLPKSKKFHHFQMNAGHYGIFNGGKWRTQVMPRIRNFIRQHNKEVDPVPEADFDIVPDLKPARFKEDKHGVKAIKKWFHDKKVAEEKEKENA